MYEIVAIGNALVDSEFVLSDEQLAQVGLTRGNMTLADETTQKALFTNLSNAGITCAKQAGGGSAANSTVAFAALGAKAFYNCRVGDDEFGKFYLADLQKSGVSTDVSVAVQTGETTGTCAVLVTPDGERTMQTHLGTSSEINQANINFDSLINAKWLYLEGYLAMSPSIQDGLDALHTHARNNGVKIAVSFADPAVVKFAKDGLEKMLAKGVDAIFCNAEEATLFAQSEGDADPVNALIKYSELVVITNSDKPTTIAVRGNQGIEEYQVESVSVPTVLDTNGAGDNYAGAFVYGLSCGYDLPTCGKLAANVAAQVVSQFGPRLSTADYQAIKTRVLG